MEKEKLVILLKILHPPFKAHITQAWHWRNKRWLDCICSAWCTIFMKWCLFLVVIIWPQLQNSWTHVNEDSGAHSSSSKGSYGLDVMGEETDASGRWSDLVDITQLSVKAKVEIWACCFIPVSLWIPWAEPMFAPLVQASKSFFSFLYFILKFLLLLVLFLIWSGEFP